MEFFPSTLIISSNQKAADEKIFELIQILGHKSSHNNPDIFTINNSTGWGIEVIRTIKGFLSQKAFNHENKIVLIYECHNLNTESQNALLKTLEEPGLNNYIFLTTNKPSSILSTIISRCYTIKLSTPKDNLDQNILKITGNLKKDLETSENLSKNKEDVLPFLETQLKLYQEELIKNPNLKTAKLIERIIKSIQMVNSNVDPKSSIDYLFLGQ
jgi:DNA polymerase III delta prime subunit